MQLTVKEQAGRNKLKSSSFILPMDVRAKQRLSYQTYPLNFSLLGGGFAPRHFKRSTASLT